MKMLTSVILVLLLVDCASITTPSVNLINEKPVVTMGASSPPHDDYILYVLAGQVFPLQLTVTGSMFSQTGEAETQVSFKRNLYLYKYWGSYDGRRWHRLNTLLGLTISAGMKPEGGLVTVGVDEHINGKITD